MFTATQIMIIIRYLFQHKFDWLNIATTVTAVTEWLLLHYNKLLSCSIVAMVTCFLLLPQAHQKYVLLSCKLTLNGSLAATTMSVFVQ